MKPRGNWAQASRNLPQRRHADSTHILQQQVLTTPVNPSLTGKPLRGPAPTVGTGGWFRRSALPGAHQRPGSRRESRCSAYGTLCRQLRTSEPLWSIRECGTRPEAQLLGGRLKASLASSLCKESRRAGSVNPFSHNYTPW